MTKVDERIFNNFHIEDIAEIVKTCLCRKSEHGKNAIHAKTKLITGESIEF